MAGPEGGSRLGCLLGLLLLGVAGYVGAVLIESEFEYRSVREAVRQELRVFAGKSDAEIQARILEEIERFDLPPGARRIFLRRRPGEGVELSLQYADTLRFFDRWRWIRVRRIVARNPP